MDSNVIDLIYARIRSIDDNINEIKTSQVVMENKYTNLSNKVCGNGEKGIVEKQEDQADEINNIKTEIASAKGMAKGLGILSTILGVLAVALSLFIAIKGLF